MADKRRNTGSLWPSALAAVVAGAVWFLAARGGFRDAEFFPFLFAAITTALASVALFIGNKERVRLALLLFVATALSWGAVWSHHAFVAGERRRLYDFASSDWDGGTFPSIPYVWATNLDGRSDFAGELTLDAPTVLVNVWATWCAPCVAEMPLLEKFWNEYRDENVSVVGVTRLQDAESDDDRARGIESIEDFVRERGVTYPVLVVDEPTYERFRTQSLPTSLWIEDGAVRGYQVSVTGAEFLLAAIKADLALR